MSDLSNGSSLDAYAHLMPAGRLGFILSDGPAVETGARYSRGMVETRTRTTGGSGPLANYEARPLMPPMPERRGRDLPDTADVVVVGGGYTGVSAARQLARQGAAVVLLEAEGLGFGASTRNGGIVHPGYHWGPTELLHRYGDETGRALYRETLDAYAYLKDLITEESIDAELEAHGHLELAYGPGHVEGLHAARKSLEAAGVACSFVPRERLREEIGSDAYFGALVVEGSGGLHPGKYFAGLADAAARAGADMHEGVRATAVRRDHRPRRGGRHERLHGWLRAVAPAADHPDRELHHRHRAVVARSRP